MSCDSQNPDPRARLAIDTESDHLSDQPDANEADRRGGSRPPDNFEGDSHRHSDST